MDKGTEAKRTLDREEVIQEMKRRLVEKFDPDAIILFGSSARGGEGKDSDIDLLVITPIEGNYTELWSAMFDALGGLGLPKDLILMTREQFERDKKYIGTIARPAWKEGKTLYERSRS